VPWVKAAEAARILGISAGTLREKARTGKVERRIVDNWTSLYLIGEDDGAESPAHETFRAQGTPDVTLDDVRHDNEGGNRYEFHEDRDTYIYWLRSKGGQPWAVNGSIIRGMLRAYSNDGAAASINRICLTHGWTRKTARDVLRAHGKTHDSAPFTDEEMASRDEDDLVDDLIRLKEEKVIRKAEKADWDKTKRLAEEAKRIDHFLLKRIEGILAAQEWAPPAQAPSIHLERKPVDTECTVVFGLTDAHVGAHAWAAECGEDNNIEIVRERTLATTRKLIERVCSFRPPSRWLLPSGSDNIHADTYAKTTTKGTPLDTDGSRAKMYLAACSLYEELISMLVAVAPVDVVTMPGNHDHDTTVMLTHWLATRFRDEQFVRVGDPTEQRSYRLQGKVLICFAHGDAIKREKLPMVMASEQGHLWGLAKHRLAFSGHYHSDIVHEYAGTRVIHMPTLARADRWHHAQGYIGQTKAISAYLIDHEEGLVASLPVQPPAKP
jgi:hypothetical protein